jgi:hypothetical protein
MVRSVRLILFLSAAVFFLCNYSFSSALDGRLSFRDSTFDFGYVVQHSISHHTFWLYSTGEDTLKITRIRPGCACTRIPLEKDVIPPGDSVRLDIIFNPESLLGPILRKPTINTYGDTTKRHIQITANVLKKMDDTRPVVIEPYRLFIIQYEDEFADRINFNIKNVSRLRLRAKLIDKPDELEITLPGEINPRRFGVGEVRIKRGALDKEFQKSFTIEFNDEEHTRFTIPVEYRTNVLSD